MENSELSNSRLPPNAVNMDPNWVQTLKTLVEKYNQVDIDLKRLRNETYDLKKVKQDISAKLLHMMTSAGLEDVRFQNSTLRYTVRKVSLPPNREVIKERLQSLFSEPERRDDAVQLVLAPRGVEERASIRKIRVR